MQQYIDTMSCNDRAICKVTKYTIVREGFTLTLDSGIVMFAHPFESKTNFAHFKGIGHIKYIPTNQVEKNQLKIYNHGKDYYSDYRNEFMFCFTDSIYEDILHKFPPVKSTSKGVIPFPIKNTRLFSTWFEHHDIIWKHALLDNKNNSSFFCFAYGDSKNPILYEYAPTEIEPIAFYIFDGTTLNDKYKFSSAGISDGSGGYSLGEIASFIKINVCPSMNSAHNPQDELSITHNTLDVKIDDGLKMAVTSRLRITANSDKISWGIFNLYKELTIDSVQDEKGNSLDFFQPDESNTVLVKLPKFTVNQSFSVTMKYKGKIIKRMDDYTFIETSIEWYPTYGYKQKSLFDITFTAPNNYKLISIGNKVSEEKKDGAIVSRWTVDYPIRNASFNIGPFSTAVSDRKDVPPITLHYINSNNKKNVLTDIAQAYEFYSKLFGPLPLQSLNATEIPYLHGEAFPGMLHLSWLTFEDSDNTGAWQSFNAHETGHQWWGIGLDYKTYRDRWLSEGFTEYASLMYLQMMLGDNQKFFEILKKSREKIINAKKQRKSDGVDLCPISLGHRVASTSLTREDYHTVIYEKGAWTLHMLRNILLNLNTMNEDGFKTIMKDFFTTYQGKSATIADFQKIVEKHVNQDVSWFFEQWVHGSDIPVYHFAFKTEKTPDDKFKVRVRVEQKEVSPDFKMSVPIKIVFENGSIARIRVFITGAKSEFDLPPLASAPKEIVFNDLESVLATVKVEDWE